MLVLMLPAEVVDGPDKEKSEPLVPFPIRCRLEPLGVELVYDTPMSVLMMPSAGPPEAVNVPS